VAITLPYAGRSPRARPARPARLLCLLAAVTVVGTVFVRYHRPIVSYLTHWKGSPTQTWDYVPFQCVR
jgi:hypothetical protein